jgi:hypothetical protein
MGVLDFERYRVGQCWWNDQRPWEGVLNQIWGRQRKDVFVAAIEANRKAEYKAEKAKEKQ